MQDLSFIIHTDLLFIIVLLLCLRQLLKDPKVIFAGYRVPHPLEHKFELRVQTTADYSPHEAFTNAMTDLISEVSLMEERLKVRNTPDVLILFF